MIRPILRIQDYLLHMVEAIDRINIYTANLGENSFLSDPKTQDAVIRNFEIIGEAAQNIRQRYPDFVASNPDVPWRSAYGMRNALTHGYFDVDMEQVWETIRNDLPLLRRLLDALLKDLDSSAPA
jgi:uncharacterized protein with HEPN domain